MLDSHPATPTTAPEEPTWWRQPGGDVDHAFGPTGWLRSRCGAVRWTVLLTPALSGPAVPCPDCLAAIGPTEGELRAMWGNR